MKQTDFWTRKASALDRVSSSILSSNRLNSKPPLRAESYLTSISRGPFKPRNENWNAPASSRQLRQLPGNDKSTSLSVAMAVVRGIASSRTPELISPSARETLIWRVF